MDSRRARAAGFASVLGIVALLTTALSGCADTVSLPAAAGAAQPRCAEVTVRLPDTVASLAERPTDSQATAAWGNPAAVLLRCGVTPPGPTTAHCVTALGIDWVVDDTNDEAIRYTTFGRSPAIEVTLDHTKVSDADVLGDLKQAVSVIPQTRRCIGLDDTDAAPTTTPAPTGAPTPAPT